MQVQCPHCGNGFELNQNQKKKTSNGAKTGGDYVMPFGKHKGKTLEEIQSEAPGYLEWCVANFDPEKEVTRAVMSFIS